MAETASGEHTGTTPPVPPFANSYVIPGTRVVAGEYPYAPYPEAATRRLVDCLDAGITTFIDLTTPADGLKPYREELFSLAEARGIEVHYFRFPIRDLGVPTAEQMRAILDRIDAESRLGHTIYLHCWGGAGLTGTTVGCLLVERGNGPAAALASVGELFRTMSDGKQIRHPWGSPETPEQKAFVRRWAHHQPGSPESAG